MGPDSDDTIGMPPKTREILSLAVPYHFVILSHLYYECRAQNRNLRFLPVHRRLFVASWADAPIHRPMAKRERKTKAAAKEKAEAGELQIRLSTICT
jgi:hypothetical protein